MLTIWICVVADFKSTYFQFSARFCLKVITLNFAQNPQLRIFFVVSRIYLPIIAYPTIIPIITKSINANLLLFGISIIGFSFLYRLKTNPFILNPVVNLQGISFPFSLITKLCSVPVIELFLKRFLHSLLLFLFLREYWITQSYFYLNVPLCISYLLFWFYYYGGNNN